MAATPLSGCLPWRCRHLLVPRTVRLQPGAADSRCLFSTSAPVATTVTAHSFHPRPPAPPNPSLKWTPNSVPPGPRSAFRLSCTARAWRHTAGVHLAPTLGLAMRVQPIHSFVAVVVACGWRSRALRHATTPGRFGLHLRGSAHHHSRVRPSNVFRPGFFSRGLTTSLKRSANGRPPGPGLRYAVHFLSPGPGVLPSSPA